MNPPASIFKAYDIRGVVPDALDEATAEALGRAFAALALRSGERAVALGRDGRLSSPALAGALARGLMHGGIDVIDIGPATTPMLYFAAHTLATSGIEVTGSHNPKDHNGFKLVLRGEALHGPAIQALGQAMRQLPAAAPPVPAGRLRPVDVLPAYIERIRGDVRLARPMKIAIDCGNGIAGASAPAVFRALGCEVVELFTEVDGHFPHHHPDPSRPENMQDLAAVVARGDAELGLAFDGDGDRLGVVARGGAVVQPDRLMMLLAADVLARVPGGAVLYDVKCTQRLAPAIEAAGGRAVMTATGHSLIKAHMKAIGAPFGGEMSGHLFFAERWYGFDDATYAGARLLELLSRSADASAPLLALPDSHSTPELHLPCAEGESHALVAQLVARARFDAPARIATIDGLRVDWPDGFGLIRASNTMPMLTLRFEGHDAAALARIEADMLGLLRQLRPDAFPNGVAH